MECACSDSNAIIPGPDGLGIWLPDGMVACGSRGYFDLGICVAGRITGWGVCVIVLGHDGESSLGRESHYRPCDSDFVNDTTVLREEHAFGAGQAPHLELGSHLGLSIGLQSQAGE